MTLGSNVRSGVLLFVVGVLLSMKFPFMLRRSFPLSAAAFAVPRNSATAKVRMIGEKYISE